MIQNTLNEAYEHGKKFLDQGKVATYIPELSKADPSHLGASVITVEGECFHVGEWQEHFTIQSISKTTSLILALQ